jgi:hypothetical protein
MRVYAAEATLILGKKRRDGSRRVLSVRLCDWSTVASALRVQEIPVQTGETGKLYVHIAEAYQRVFLFLEESFPGEPSPIHRRSRQRQRKAKLPANRNGGSQ